MNSNLYKAILSMDSYNRGYNAGIDFRLKNTQGLPIEDSDTIYTDSTSTHNAKLGNLSIAATRGQADAQSIGFYAIAYEDQTTHEKIISYRGTDDFKSAAASLVMPPHKNQAGGGGGVSGTPCISINLR